MRRSVGLAVILVLFVGILGAGTLETHTLTIVSKTWTQVPEQHRQPTPLWKFYVGNWSDRTRHRQGVLYLHRIENFGWEYKVKDENNKFFIMYAGRDWSFAPGTILIISGEAGPSGVFIPQGERLYGK